MNDVRSLSPAPFTLHNFLFFSLHCPFSLRIFSKNDYLFNVHFVISSSKANKGQQGGRGSKLGILSERTFWMSPNVSTDDFEKVNVG